MKIGEGVMTRAARNTSGAKQRIAAPKQPQQAAEVILDFVFEDGLLFVALQNISDRPAYDVSATFDKPFCGSGGEQDVSRLRMFKRTPFLAPRRTIRTFVDSTAAYFDRNEPTSIMVEVTYRNAESAECAHTIEHDLAIYRDISFVDHAAPAGTAESRDW
jgi:hypothetical protein